MQTTTNTLSSQITGNDYFSAYRSRMQVNHQHFLNVAKELTELGCSVYVPTYDRLIEYLHIQKDDKHILFGFTDVPYRWYLSYNIDYRKGDGSGRTLKEVFDYDSPFTAAEIIAAMQPNVPVQVKPTQYLKLFTI